MGGEGGSKKAVFRGFFGDFWGVFCFCSRETPHPPPKLVVLSIFVAYFGLTGRFSPWHPNFGLQIAGETPKNAGFFPLLRYPHMHGVGGLFGGFCRLVYSGCSLTPRPNRERREGGIRARGVGVFFGICANFGGGGLGVFRAFRRATS